MINKKGGNLMSNLTTNALKKTFEEMLEKQSLSKITIQQLVDKCGVGRNTFYYHYQDIYMLLEDLLEDKKSILIEQIKNYETDEVFLMVFEYFIKYQNVIYHIQNSIDTRIIEKYLNEIFKMISYQYIEKNMENITIDNNELKFVIDFVSYAFTGMVINWFTNDFSEEVLKDNFDNIKKYLNGDTLKKFLYK